MGGPLYVVIAIVFNFYFSRYACCYTQTSLIKKYVRIKNDLCMDIFIASSRGRGSESESDDRDKMSIIGVISYSYMILTILPFLWGQFFQNVIVMKRMCNMIFWISWPITFMLTILTDSVGFIYGTRSDRFEERYWYSRLGSKIGTIVVLLGLAIYILYEISIIYDCIVALY